MHHDGFAFQAAAVTLSPKDDAVIGPCVEASTSASSRGRSGAKNWATPARDIQRNPFDALTAFNPGGVGYPFPRSVADCPSSGAKAFTYTKPTTLGSVPTWVITIPPHHRA